MPPSGSPNSQHSPVVHADEPARADVEVEDQSVPSNETPGVAGEGHPTPEDEKPVSLIGRTCEVYCDNKWFNAVTVSVRKDAHNDDKVVVRILGTENAREYGLVDIKLLPIAPRGEFPVGTKVQAIWKDDGLWYNASVNGFTDNAEFVVAFDGFDTEPEVVNADQVRKPIIVDHRPKPRVPKPEKTYVTPAGYVIPEKLKIDPTRDSEAVIAEKKRKIHLVKSQQRTEKHTEDVTTSKNSWQQFQQKIARR